MSKCYMSNGDDPCHHSAVWRIMVNDTPIRDSCQLHIRAMLATIYRYEAVKEITLIPLRENDDIEGVVE